MIINYIKINKCPDSSEAEHFLGKEEVGGSIPLLGSTRNMDKSIT